MTRRIPAEHPAEALAVLTDAVAALQRAGVTAWLTDGTLLGAVRERRFIAHDRDMDLGAMITQHSGAAMRELRAAGFHLRKTLGSKAAGLEHKLDRDGFRLDIFWHYDSPDGGVWHAAWDRGRMIRYHYSRLVLAPLMFMRRAFWAPSPPKLHLAQKYGLGWRTPKRDWDWALDPINAQPEPATPEVPA